MSLENYIKNWIIIDNNIKDLNSKIQDNREKKNYYNNLIINHANNNNLDNITIKINNGYIKLTNTTISESLTYKFLENCLNKYFKNDSNKSKEIINFIKKERNVKYIKELKRIYN